MKTPEKTSSAFFPEKNLGIIIFLAHFHIPSLIYGNWKVPLAIGPYTAPDVPNFGVSQHFRGKINLGKHDFQILEFPGKNTLEIKRYALFGDAGSHLHY